MDTFENRPLPPEQMAGPAEPENGYTFQRGEAGQVFRPAAAQEQVFRPAVAREQVFRPAVQPEPVPEPVQEPAKKWTERKASPYADSPYVCMPRQEETFAYTPETGPQDKQPRKKGKFWRRALAAVLTVALVAAGCGITAYLVDRQWQEQTALTAQQTQQQFLQMQEQIDQLKQNPATIMVPSGNVSFGDGLTPAQVYSENVDSVVAINVTIQDSFYGEAATAGSGFILTQDGYVVTNYHVVEGATAVSVGMVDGTTLDAKVVGYDATNDIAVLKVEAQGLPAAVLGSSSAMKVGDMVVAIGNPLGELNATQTVGFICGKDREITTGGTIINMLQTDAAINPGNSGGPLFNMAGQVIGITTAKYSGTTSSGASIEGIGFAIPIDDVLGIITDLQTYGYVTGAYLGVVVQNVDPTVSDIYDITGAYVISVEPGYAADRAGIRAKDLIVGLEGQTIGSITELTRALRAYKAGDTVTVTLIRAGVQMDVEVTLDEKPQTLEETVPEEEAEMPSEGDYDEWYDFFFGK